jgi:hypothetical protein
MAEKTPYEIRMELLKLSQDYLMGVYNTQKYLVEKQMVIAEDIVRGLNLEAVEQLEVAQKNFDETAKAMNEVIGMFPTQDLILETAKKFQEFVNKKV